MAKSCHAVLSKIQYSNIQYHWIIGKVKIVKIIVYNDTYYLRPLWVITKSGHADRDGKAAHYILVYSNLSAHLN